jgi:hypothetical protein
MITRLQEIGGKDLFRKGGNPPREEIKKKESNALIPFS